MRKTCRVTEGRFIEHLHMTSRHPYWCSKTIQRWPFCPRKSCWSWTPCHVKAMNLPKLTPGFFSFSPRDTHVTFPFFPHQSLVLRCMVVVVNVRPKAKRRKNSLDEPNEARIHTSFHCFTEICQIFYNKYIFIEKKNFIKLSKLKSGKWLGQSVNILSEWLRNSGKGTLGSWNRKHFSGGAWPQTFVEIRNRSVFILDPRLQT